MADITPDFNICLKAKGAQAVLTKEYNVDEINSFMQEAYRIVNTPICMMLICEAHMSPECPHTRPHPRTPLNPLCIPLHRSTSPPTTADR